MMIRHDDIHAQTACEFHLVIGHAAAICRNDQIRSSFFNPGNGFPVKPIAFIKAGRYVIGKVGIQCAEQLHHQADAANTVSIVISVNADMFFPSQRCLYPFYGFLHIF
jgi:hypothetical protein